MDRHPPTFFQLNVVSSVELLILLLDGKQHYPTGTYSTPAHSHVRSCCWTHDSRSGSSCPLLLLLLLLLVLVMRQVDHHSVVLIPLIERPEVFFIREVVDV
jgi:hypothetical protein